MIREISSHRGIERLTFRTNRLERIKKRLEKIEISFRRKKIHVNSIFFLIWNSILFFDWKTFFLYILSKFFWWRFSALIYLHFVNVRAVTCFPCQCKYRKQNQLFQDKFQLNKCQATERYITSLQCIYSYEQIMENSFCFCFLSRFFSCLISKSICK